MRALLADAVPDGLGSQFDGLLQLIRSRCGVVPDDIADGSLDLEATPPSSALLDALGVSVLLIDVELGDRELDDVFQRRP